MVSYCIENLHQIKRLLQSLSSSQFTYKSELLGQSSLGQHVRHILEFYECALMATPNGVINYDNRTRDLNLENHLEMAIDKIESFEVLLSMNIDNFPITLEGDFCDCNGLKIRVDTFLYRELTYCLEHSIHHQALIKVGLREFGIVDLVEDCFGVAYSTIRFQQSQMQ